MPMYHFRISDGSGHPDPDPMELPDYETARGELVELAGEMLRGVDGHFWSIGHWQIDVTNEADLILCSLQVNGVEARVIK